MVAYIEEKLGQPFDSIEADEVEEFDKKINQFLDTLADDPKEEIEKFIK